MSIAFFLAFVIATLSITFVVAKKNTGSSAYFAAGRSITGWQNGLAVAGDYMSAASFLGITSMIAAYGFDGFMYSVGFLVAYLTVLFVVAEPLRNAGKYTMADLLAYRLKEKPVRAVASLSTLTVSTFYMIAQIVGAAVIVNGLLPEGSKLSFNTIALSVGLLMIVYVIFGGMKGTTWVQIIKAILLMIGTIFLSFLVLKTYDFSFTKFFDAASHIQTAKGVKNFLDPGMKYGAEVSKWEPLNLVSLGMALVFGTAGLPHILVRFYTVPDAKTARVSVVWAMIIIGVFYILTTFMGYGAALLLEKPPGPNMAAPELARALGGEVFFSFISAVAFATILAVVAGLTISASTSFAHDLYTNVIRAGKETSATTEVKVARIASFGVGFVSIGLAIVLQKMNVAFLVGLAFSIAASSNLPVIVLSIFWKRFNTAGAVTGILTGLISSIGLIAISPAIMGKAAIFPLENPGLVSIPLGFLGAILGTLFTREPEAEEKFAEFAIRAHTGLGAEKASDH